MRVGGKEIDMTFLDIQGKCTKALDRVNAEKSSSLTAEVAQTFQVHSEPVRELHRAYRKQPRPGIHETPDVIGKDPALP